MNHKYPPKSQLPGFVAMAELGEMFGVTSHIIGRWLCDAGLRTRDDRPGKKPGWRPSQRALSRGMVRKAASGEKGYYYLWQVTKTIKALQDAGHKLKDEAH